MSKKTNEIPISREDLPELLFIGVPVNVSFKHGDFSKFGQLKEVFLRRKNEIPNILDTEYFYAPWYNCEVMFTYFFCMRVSNLEQIPEGMIGFAVPGHTYLRAQYDGVYPFDPDPYEELKRYREMNDLSHNQSAMVIEKYAFSNGGMDGRMILDVYGPIEF